MCARCTLDLRAMRLSEVAALRDDPPVCDRVWRAIDAELLERLQGQDLDEADDEQV